MNKPYDCGLLLGRFQTFHIGHESLVMTGLKLCDRMIIMIGSSQESRTERNPFNILTRTKVIREVFDDEKRVIIYPIPDLTHEDDITFDWGKYVLEHCDGIICKPPELMIYGNDEARSRWFDPEDIKHTSEFIVPRSRIQISATDLRKMMVNDERRKWMTWVNPRLHKLYPELRTELMEVPFYSNKL